MDLDSYVIVRARPAPKLGGPVSAQRRLRGGARTRLESRELAVETAGSLSRKDLRDAREDPKVLSVAPVMRLKLHRPKGRDDDAKPAGDVAWGVRAVGAVESAFDGAGVRVAVLDTGIAEHAAFAHASIKQRDFTGDGVADEDGHGTHCAGTIFGAPVGGVRIGIAPKIEKALIGKVIGEDGATTAALAKAIQWALEEGAHVMSMSLGFDFPGYVDELVRRKDFPADLATSRALENYRANLLLFDSLFDFVKNQATDYQPCLIVAASGNESRRDENPEHEIAASPPSNARGVLAVGALMESAAGLTVAPFSNARVSIAAPGAAIASARRGGGLVALDGTSMATPHVAGVAALWAQKLMSDGGQLDYELLRASVLASCTLAPLAADRQRDDVGAGLVQAPRG